MSSTVTATPAADTRAAAKGLGSPAYLLFVLTLVGTVNWADRQVVPILFPGIRRDLGLNDTELGIIGGLAFSLIYALSSFFFGYAADRFVRKYVIAGALVLWSLATMASGLATSFWTLFAARFFTGIGEASLYPCALSLIAERFPSVGRGRALGIFGAAAALGSGFGVGLGGKLSESVGWQNVFFIYGAVGFVVLPLMLLVREAPRPASAARAESTGTAIKAALADKRLLWLWACGTLAIASGHGFGTWVPSYFVRDLGLDVKQAGALFGGAALLGGILGGIVGGTLADRRRKARVGGEFDVSAVAAFAGAVLVLYTLEAGPGTKSALGGLLATVAIYGLFPGLLSAMLSFVPSHRHGVTGAINTLCLGGIGAATGPFVIGAASDRMGSLHMALYIPIAGLCLAGALAIRAGQVARDAGPAPAVTRDAT
jgi:MFS transporter, Spinster family, sphingosine-1-phosphate transporter